MGSPGLFQRAQASRDVRKAEGQARHRLGPGPPPAGLHRCPCRWRWPGVGGLRRTAGRQRCPRRRTRRRGPGPRAVARQRRPGRERVLDEASAPGVRKQSAAAACAGEEERAMAVQRAVLEAAAAAMAESGSSLAVGSEASARLAPPPERPVGPHTRRPNLRNHRTTKPHTTELTRSQRVTNPA